MKHMFRHSLIANTPGLLDLRTAKINLMLLPAPRVRSSRVSRPRRASTAEKGVEPKVDAPPATQGRGRTDRPERAGGLGLSCPPRRVTDTGEHRFPAAPPPAADPATWSPVQPPLPVFPARKSMFRCAEGAAPTIDQHRSRQSCDIQKGGAACSRSLPSSALRSEFVFMSLPLSLPLSLSPSLPLSLSPRYFYTYDIIVD